MTIDNGDFMSRYLDPEGGPERPAPIGALPHPPAAPSMPAPAAPSEPTMQSSTPPPETPLTPASPSHVAVAAPAHQDPPTPPPPSRERGASIVQPGRETVSPAGQLPDNTGHRREIAPPAPPPARFEVATVAQRWAPQADHQAAAYTHQQIQVGEVVKRHRQPPEMGWRKTVYTATFRTINLGAGPAERTLIDRKRRITTNIPGNYQITALSMKGGVGKSTLVAAVGTTLRKIRNEAVIAIDANPTYGSLGRLIARDGKPPASIREFLAHNDLTSFSVARQYFGSNDEGLEVLAGNPNVTNPLILTAQVFADTIARTQGFYQLSLVDCGAEIEHQVIPAVLSSSNALMIVGSMNLQGGLAVEKTVDWLAARNGHELLKRSFIVLTDAYRCATKKFVTEVTEKVGPRVRGVKVIPFDAHLRDAQPLVFDALRPRTQTALIELAAELADGFPTAGALVG
ncbi:MinD/ParA family protein [Mycobacterium sp.]|uniref:MinD/ParA family ATP-binding protein n=1 Tax=Mycobacterium sp. TaxID=1785 RepID=UPI0025800BDB|nr:MinD/ParA family protein [Mycobacterium sp.]